MFFFFFFKAKLVLNEFKLAGYMTVDIYVYKSTNLNLVTTFYFNLVYIKKTLVILEYRYLSFLIINSLQTAELPTYLIFL